MFIAMRENKLLKTFVQLDLMEHTCNHMYANYRLHYPVQCRDKQ